MEGRILVVFAGNWIPVGALRMSDRQIRLAQVQGASGSSSLLERTKMSRVPGKASKVNNMVSVPQTDTGRLGE